MKLAGANDPVRKSFLVQSGFDYKKKLDRREYVRVQIKTDEYGKLVAEKYGRDGAGNPVVHGFCGRFGGTF